MAVLDFAAQAGAAHYHGQHFDHQLQKNVLGFLRGRDSGAVSFSIFKLRRLSQLLGVEILFRFWRFTLSARCDFRASGHLWELS